VISMNTRGVPSFSDERQKGIEMMAAAEDHSIFLRPAASHALTYTWIEEGKMARAQAVAERLLQKYPNNIINQLVLGRVQMYRKQYENSEATYKQVLTISPNNERVHYYLQRLYLRWNKPELSEQHADIYLSFNINDDQKAYSLFYKGNIYYQRQDWDEAERLYRLAYRANRMKRAKSRLERIEQRREGN